MAEPTTKLRTACEEPSDALRMLLDPELGKPVVAGSDMAELWELIGGLK